jgi:hypothetical protein
MRVTLLIAGVAAAMLSDLRAGHAYQGPWCAVQSLGFGTVTHDCSMRTFEQCRMETSAGNRGFCTPNPRWPGAYGADDPYRRPYKRRVRYR